MKRPVDIHWHIYSGSQIRPEFRGRLVYLLELAATGQAPLLQEFFDPMAREFPAFTRDLFSALVESGYHAVVYSGLNKTAIEELRAQAPEISSEDHDFAHYNRHLLLNARYSLLSNPVRSQPGYELVSGSAFSTELVGNR